MSLCLYITDCYIKVKILNKCKCVHSFLLHCIVNYFIILEQFPLALSLKLYFLLYIGINITRDRFLNFYLYSLTIDLSRFGDYM